MSGHSKWHNIKVKKSKMDSLKGKLFTRVSKEILMAVKEGGPDPESNFRLKVAVQRAREVNMPGDNIKRTIEKASGAGAEAYEEIRYEGYGPGGVAVIIEVATDNRNRTAAEVRRIFTKFGNALGESGCVSWMFEKKGLILISDRSINEDELLALALDLGAEDMKTTEDGYEIYTDPATFAAVRNSLDEKKIPYDSAEISWIPSNTVKVEGDDAGKILRFIDEIEELEDVQQVYANFDISPELMEKLG